MINFEDFESKMGHEIEKKEWKRVQNNFNNAETIILFGHGGNMGVCDHAAIDIGRLTDKATLSPGSAILATSLISDFGFTAWIKEWLRILFRSIDATKCLVIGNSCSVGTDSSKTICDALKYANSQGANIVLISARESPEFTANNIITHSIYYHTHEVMSLMLFYQLIYGYKNSSLKSDLVECPPSINVRERIHDSYRKSSEKCSTCDFGALDHSFCNTQISHVPPGFEKDLKNIAVDFDGVVHNFDKGYYDGTCYGDPISGSLRALQQLSKHYKVIIHSAKCRKDRPLVNGLTGRDLIVNWLKKHNVLQYVTDITARKPRAVAYIDDKGVKFDNNWTEVLKSFL